MNSCKDWGNTMTIDEVNSIVVQIIAFAGDSKSYSMEALSDVERDNFDEAEVNLQEAEKQLTAAHEVHTKLLVEEARKPGSVPITLMVVHASNHLSGAEVTFDLVKHIVQISKLKKK